MIRKLFEEQFEYKSFLIASQSWNANTKTKLPLTADKSNSLTAFEKTNGDKFVGICGKLTTIATLFPH